MRLSLQILFIILIIPGCGIVKKMEFYSLLETLDKNEELAERIESEDCEENLLILISARRFINGNFPKEIDEVYDIDFDLFLKDNQRTDEEKAMVENEIDSFNQKVIVPWKECSGYYESILFQPYDIDSLKIAFSGSETVENKTKVNYTKNWKLIIYSDSSIEISHINTRIEVLDSLGRVLLSSESYEEMLKN